MATTAYAAFPRVDDAGAVSQAEDEELYRQLLRLQDVVLAGKHPIFKLPASAIERIKNAASQQPALNGAVNGTAFTANTAQQQQSSAPSSSAPNGSLNFQTSSAPLVNGSKPTSSTALDPIFLQKSHELVRAEGQIKRQRLDRDLQAHAEQRKQSSRDKDPAAEAPSPIDVDAVLLNAWERVRPVSGLTKADKGGSGASSSFDENDYYSSQVESDWSSDANSNQGSDGATGAFTADFERLDGVPLHSTAAGKRPIYHTDPAMARSAQPQRSMHRPHVYTSEPGEVYELEDDDDEYTPPDASPDDYQIGGVGNDMQPTTEQDDDNSEYEPGEIEETNYPTPYQPPQPTQPSPQVPVIRNRLTHLAAPQPNRVSPLATAKGQGFELELVNGRPEVVQKPQPQRRQNFDQSRASSASPSANGVGGSGKKRRTKKRKRDAEPTGRVKKKKSQQQIPAAQDHREAYIKNEPVSPPPSGNFQQIPQYVQVSDRHAPVDLTSPTQAPQMQYGSGSSRSGLRYEFNSPTASHVVTATTPTYRPVQRDNQDLRRVASLQYAQRPASPQQQHYSPVGPYRAASMAYGEQRIPHANEAGAVMYQEQPTQAPVQYTRNAQSRSPPGVRESREMYVPKAPTPVTTQRSTASTRRVVVDQYGNKYYAAPEPNPAPAPAPPSRATAVPMEAYVSPEVAYSRAPSRMTVSYTQPPQPAAQYNPEDSRMAPPPTISRRQQPPPEPPVQYIDSNGYPMQEYIPRSAEAPTRYLQSPASPVYQQIPRGYEQTMMPPPQPQFRPQPQHQQVQEPTSPVYVPNRSYSVRPDAPQPQLQQQQPTYLRSGTVAPVQYVRREVQQPQQQSVRAASVMPPGADYGAPQQLQQRESVYAPAPQGVRYVDQDGNEVFPAQVRQVSEFRY